MNFCRFTPRATMVFLCCSTPILGISAPSDPVASMEKIVAACELAYGKQPAQQVALMSEGSKWIKFVHAPAKITYDVKKSDSLVSPYVGVIEITTLSTSGKFATEEEANQKEVTGGDERRNKDVFHYAYRAGKGKWEFVSGYYKTDYNGPSYKTVVLPPMTGQYSTGDITDKSQRMSCLSP